MNWRRVLRFPDVISIFRRPTSIEIPPRVLFVTEGQTACSELVTKPLYALRDQGKIRLKVAFEHDFRGAQLRRMAKVDCDLLIVFRGSTRRGLRTLFAAKRAGKRTVWASDDDLLSLDASNPVGRRYERPKVRKTIETMMQRVDGLWTFSGQMAEKYRAMGIKNVHRSHSLAPLRDSGTLTENTPAPHPTCVRIGHIGDYSHANEMHHLVGAINALSTMDLEHKWEFDFVGHTPDELAGHPHVRSIPYINGVDAFHQWLGAANWSIGIAPLRDTPFNRCKTDNKFRTFSAFDIAGVYANMPPYSDAVEHNKTGLLCTDNPEAYAKCLAELIRSDFLRRAIQINAKQVCIERYSQEAVVAQYESIICNLLDLPGLSQTSAECYPAPSKSFKYGIGA